MKILFIHGLASSGAYKMAGSLRILMKGSEVIAPDVPIDPFEALVLLKNILAQENPDLIVGLSLGAFWAQKLRGFKKILVNPDFHPSRLLRTMVGTQNYLSPRLDGATSFEITEEICDGYRSFEDQFAELTPEEISMTLGLFADADEITQCRPEFELHYPNRAISYPGGHLPNFPQLKSYLVPAINRIFEFSE